MWNLLLLVLAFPFHQEVRNLSHPDWRVREGATEALKGAGAFAYPALLVGKDDDLERSSRIDTLVNRTDRRLVDFILPLVAYADLKSSNEWCGRGTAERWANLSRRRVLAQVAMTMGLIKWEEVGWFEEEVDPYDHGSDPISGRPFDLVDRVQGTMNVMMHRAKGTPLPYPHDPTGPRLMPEKE